MKRFAALFFALCLALNLSVTAFAETAEKTGLGEVGYGELPPVALEPIAFSEAGPAALSENGVILKEGNYVRFIDRVEIPD